MPSHRRPQMTLAKIMTLNGVIAVLLAAYRLRARGTGPVLHRAFVGVLRLLLRLARNRPQRHPRHSLSSLPAAGVAASGSPLQFRQVLPMHRLPDARASECSRSLAGETPPAPRTHPHYRRKSPAGKWLSYTNPGSSPR